MNKSDKERQKYTEDLKTWITDAKRRKKPRRRWRYINGELCMFGIVDHPDTRYRCFHPHPARSLSWQQQRDFYTIPNPMEPILFDPWSKNQK